MKKLLGIIAAAAFLLAAPVSGPALAQEGDTTTLTCGELFELEALDMTMVYVWLDGYVSAKTGHKYLDFDVIGANLKALAQPCAANKDTLVLDLMGQK